MQNLSYENELCMEFQSHANQSHFHKNDFALGHLDKGTRKWPILSTALITFLCRTRQNIEHFGGIMDHVQILVLVACFMLLNLAQITDETLLMVQLVFMASISWKPSCPFNG